MYLKWQLITQRYQLVLFQESVNCLEIFNMLTIPLPSVVYSWNSIYTIWGCFWCSV